jgi:hypothetical protein
MSSPEDEDNDPKYVLDGFGRLAPNEIQAAATLSHKTEWEGIKYYYKYYRGPSMCYQCFQAAVRIADKIVEAAYENDLDFSGGEDLVSAENLMQRTARDRGYDVCGDKLDCDHEFLSSSEEEEEEEEDSENSSLDEK